MNTLPALPSVVYLAGRYMTSLDMFMAKVRDVLSSTRRNALIEQEHLLALYRDGVLLAWLRTLSSTDHHAGSMAESMEKSMKMQLTDTDAKKYIAKLFGSEIQPVSSLKFSEYVELLPECRVSYDMKLKSEPHIINEMIDVRDAEDFALLTLSFRIIKAANDILPVTLGENTVNIDLRTKGEIVSEVFQVLLSDEGDFTADLKDGHSVIHTFSFDCGWVDLGFGVKWAKCNLGAKHPFEEGYQISWDDFKKNPNDCLADFDDMFDDPTLDGTFAIKGSRWRVPTKEHYEQLLESCVIEKNDASVTPRYIRLVSKINNKAITFEEGWYLSSSAKDSSESYYFRVKIRPEFWVEMFSGPKKYHHSVRPIYIG